MPRDPIDDDDYEDEDDIPEPDRTGTPHDLHIRTCPRRALYREV